MSDSQGTIFTDGASKGNPGPGGFGAIVAYGGDVIELGGREEMTTNNRMELSGAIAALSFVSGHARDLKFVAYSDSSYVVNGLTKWLKGWQLKGWKTSLKKDVENRDLWERLAILSEDLNIEWKQVAGHADTPGNARCDEIASAFAEGARPTLYQGVQTEYKIDLQKIGARGKRGKPFYVSVINGVSARHESWNDCERRVKGVKGAKFKKVFSDEEAMTVLQGFTAKEQ